MNQSNVNNYAFAKLLDIYKRDEIDKLEKNVEDAFKIISDLAYPWKTPEAKVTGQTRFDQMQARLTALKKFYEEGMKLVMQHEGLTNNLSKWYDKWYSDISNEGRQEAEMMGSQADILQQIFVEIYQELKPLNLNIKQPKALNLK